MKKISLIKKNLSSFTNILFSKDFKFNYTVDKNNIQDTPKRIVQFLDEYIIGQPRPKKILAIAYRNRYRRKRLDKEFQNEIIPKNILMAGPTGSGKTELARRLANYSKSPFIKVEATHYTEVGYYGKDVDSIIGDLVKLTEGKVKEEIEEMSDKIKSDVERYINLLVLDLLLGADFRDQKTREGKLKNIEKVL